MLVEELLLNTLEELNKDDFETFKWYLQMKVLEECKPISQSRLEEASRTKTVRLLKDSYGDDLAVKISVKILKKQSLNDVAERLWKGYAEKETSASSSSSASSTSSTVTPPVAPMLSAQNQSVIVAPTLSDSTTGSWNITISKS